MCQNSLSYFRKTRPVSKRVQDHGIAVYWKETWKFLISTIRKTDVTPRFLYLHSLFLALLPTITLIQSTISGVTAAYNREQLWLANENLITKLQACCRGYLVRQEFNSRMNFLKKQVPAITCIQVMVAFNYVWNLYSAIVFYTQTYWQFLFNSNSYSTQVSSPHFANFLKAFPSPKEFWCITYFSMSYIINKVF